MTSVEGLKEFEANTRWIGRNYRQLKEKYPDRYVAVWKENVVEYGNDLLSIMEALKKKYPKDHSHIPVEYISTEDIHLILEV